MDLLNKEEKKFEDAKDFVLHNCYDDVKNEGNFHSEVCPSAFYSYLKYPLFKNHKDSNAGYKPYYIEKNKRYYSELNEKIECKHISVRRQSSCRGLFFSKDDVGGKKRVNNKNLNIDLSGDVITSIKTSLNNLLTIRCNLGKTTKKVINCLQLRDFDSIKFLFESLNNRIDDKKKFDKLRLSIEWFSWAIGTIGNRMPIPEGTNPPPPDNYYYKFKYLYKNLFDEDKVDISKAYSKIRFHWLFCQEDYKQNNESWKLFVEDFCLQDYFEDKDYEIFIKPCKNMDEKDSGYPSKEASIKDWRDWFNCNTCLILKRGARIYTEGCGEKDNEKKNKARKELAIKLISDVKRFKDEAFSLADWYKNNQESYQLEKLFD